MLQVDSRVRLLDTVLRALPAILTGALPATEVMFPNASMVLVEGIYRGNPIADYYNAVLGDALVAYLQERLRLDPAARIRIMEIGAGTGGTSAMLFQRLRPYQAQIEEYCYTDLSRAFLFHAQKSYGSDNPYLSYRIFDASKPFAGQGMEAGVYDVVVAANVLHATSDVRLSMRSAKAALRRNGVILLNEISVNQLFTQITFGLLDGWWLYQDGELRIPGCPGLSPDAWKGVLEEAGFRSVQFPANEGHGLGQQIIIAESDGIVCMEGALAGMAPPQASRAIAAAAPALEPPVSVAQAVRAQKPKLRSAAVQVSDRMIVDYVRSEVLDCVSKILKIEVARVQEDCSFAEYGLDSILAVSLVNLINERFVLRLQTTVLFDYNNIKLLAKHLVDEHKHALAAHLQGQGSGEAVDEQVEVDHAQERKPRVRAPGIG
jgi:acyl carrier protein/SAM-dependent methyltransferase